MPNLSNITQSSTKQTPRSTASAVSKISASYGFGWVGGNVDRTIDYSFKFFENEQGNLRLDQESQNKFDDLLEILDKDLIQRKLVSLIGLKDYAGFAQQHTIQINNDGTKSEFSPYEEGGMDLRRFRSVLLDKYCEGIFDFDWSSRTYIPASIKLRENGKSYAFSPVRISGVVYFNLDNTDNDMVIDTRLHYETDEHGLPYLKPESMDAYHKLLNSFDNAIKSNPHQKLCYGNMAVNFSNHNINSHSGFYVTQWSDIKMLMKFRDYVKDVLPHPHLRYPDIEQKASLCTEISTQMREGANALLACFSNCIKDKPEIKTKQLQDEVKEPALKAKLIV